MDLGSRMKSVFAAEVRQDEDLERRSCGPEAAVPVHVDVGRPTADQPPHRAVRRERDGAGRGDPSREQAAGLPPTSLALAGSVLPLAMEACNLSACLIPAQLRNVLASCDQSTALGR